eukprot:4428252-Pyramimonas_sp.AAC.1
MSCAIRRRLGIVVRYDGGGQHGHSTLATNLGGRLNSRHTWLLTARRQVLTETGGAIPDRSEE